jgi:hypothetical protein
MIIHNKAMFYLLAHHGLCGNTPRFWRTAVAFAAHLAQTKTWDTPQYGARSITPSATTYYNLNGAAALEVLKEYSTTYVITEVPMAQDRGLFALQGELSIVDGEYYLHAALNNRPQRIALADCFATCILRGATARLLLKQQCDAGSLDMLDVLLETYDAPYPRSTVIEFVVMPPSVPRIGRYPYLNTLIWEVRSY